MASEGSGGGELAQLVADHIFSNIHRDVLAAVVDRKGVTDEIRVSVGPGGNVDGKDVVMTVKPGDKVITSQYAGTKVTLEDVEYVVVRQNDILAIVE